MEQRQPIERQWARDLSEIVTKVMQAARSHGRDTSGGVNEWEDRGKVWETENISVEVVGDEEGGPFRLSVYANTTEGSGGFTEPLLRVEIRPGVWWMNEVRRLAEERAEPVPIH